MEPMSVDAMTYVDADTVEDKIDWMCSPRGAIRINVEIKPGCFVCIVPDPEIVGRWQIVADYRDEKLAVEFARGYCAFRDSRLATQSR